MKNFLLSALLLLAHFFAYSQIGGGHTFSAMLSSDGKVYTFGQNSSGEAGLGYTSQAIVSPKLVTSLPTIKAIETGSGSHMLALACDSTIWSWGLGSCGQLGVSSFDASGTYASSSTPVHVEKGAEPSASIYLSKVVSICSGNEQSYAVLSNGNVMAWGKNNFGQLGNGTTVNSNTPVYVMTSAGVRLTNVVALDAGDEHCYALLANGSVWSWGNNNNMALGRSMASPYYETYAAPVLKIGGTSPLKNITAIAAGDNHGLAIDSTGHVWSWGGNWGYGQLGNASNAPSLAGQVVDIGVTSSTGPFLSNVISIAAGNSFSLAVLSDGRVVSWGSNNFSGSDICPFTDSQASGQLGVGMSASSSCGSSSTEYTSSPVVVLTAPGTPLQNIVSVHRGDAWAFAISSSGNVYNWGWNREGQLGNGTTSNSNYAKIFTLPAGTIPAYPCPVANIGPDVSVCPGSGKTLKAGKAMISYTYTWSYSATKNGIYTIVAGPTTGTAGASYTTTEIGYYKVQISDTRPVLGCTSCSTSSDTIYISAIPLPYTANNSTFCGDSATFSVSGTGAYNWYDSYAGGTKRNTSTVNSIRVPLTQAHQVNSNTYELYVEDVANTAFTVAPSPSCAGSTINGSNSPVMFQAYSNFTLDSVKFVQPAYISSNYSVQIFSNNPTGGPYCSNCCGGSPCNTDGPSLTPLAVSPVISLPVGSVNTIRTIPVNINITGSLSGTKYWIVLNGTVQVFNCVPSPGFPFTDDATNPSIKIVKALYNNAVSSNYGTVFNWHISKGSYNPCSRIAVRSVANCTPVCSNKPSSVAINPMSPLTLCDNVAGDSVILKTTVTPATPPTGVYQYRWFKNGVLINGAASSSYLAKVSGGTADYSVKVNNSTDTDTGCYRSSNVVGVIVRNVEIANAGYDQVISDSTAILYGNISASTSGVWTLQNGTGVINDPSSFNTSVSSVSVGSSTFRWTLTETGCPSTYDDVTVERILCPNKPDSITITPLGSLIMCGNNLSDSVTLKTTVYPLSPASGTYIYTWYRDGILYNDTTTSYVVKADVGAGTYTYSVWVRSSVDDSGACSANADTLVYILDVPLADAGNDQITTDSVVLLQGNFPYPPATGNWTLQSGSATIDNPSYLVTTLSSVSLGISVLRWTLTVPGCTPEYDEVTIERGQVPSVPMISGPTSVPYGQQLTYSVPFDPALNYSWNISASGTIISGQNSNTVSVTFNDSGLPQADSLSVTVTNKFGISYSSKMLLGLTTGISSSNFNNQFTFSPNPFSSEGIITNTLASGTLTVCIADLMGKEIFRSDYPAGMTISIGKDLKNGVYLLTILGAESKMTSRIIKID